MLNPLLFPQKGTDVNGLFPADGIAEANDVGQDIYMDSWDALRRNLTSLMEAANDGLRSGPTGVLQLEAATDIGKSTLYRILDPRVKNPTQLDTLERIARAYSLQVWQLLVPRLDPLDAPECVGSRQMTVLRSVFAQTQLTASGHGDEGRIGSAGHGASAPDHRLRASGAPTESTAVGDRHVPKRRRPKS